MIHVRGLTKRVVQPGKKPRTLLEGIDLQIEAGTLFGLIGPGASGKSVLLKMLTGLMRPDTGEVSIEGEDITKASELRLQEIRKRIGMLFQNNALFDHMTVGENIAFPLRRLFALPESEIESRIAERLDCVALSGFQARMPSGLSGGQKKRVGVARATVTRAPIVFYDEPAAGLDPVTSQKIFDLLRKEQRAAGATVVMVSSDLDRLLTVTDRVGMLHRGQLVFQGTTEEAKTTMDPLVRQFVHGLGEGPL